MKYSKAVYFATNGVSIDRLEQEIRQSDITVALDRVGADPTDVEITFKDTLSQANEDILLNTIFPNHSGLPLEDPVEPQAVDVQSETPFAAKKIMVNGVEKSLFKRVHGCTSSYTDTTDPQNPVTTNEIPAGKTGYIELIIPYNTCKFTAAEIIGPEKGDAIDFFVLDDDNNTYSGAPVQYPNWMLNQFGFDVKMPTAPLYKDKSAYDADLYTGMIVMCAYKNNGVDAKVVDMNVTLHEVK